MLINAIPELLKSIPNMKVVFAGSGVLFDECKHLTTKLGIEKHFLFLGERSDIDTICRIADIHVSTSKLEGQGINNIEAMACGCPLVVSNVRGHRDVCKNGQNGFLFELNEPQEMIKYIVLLYKDKNLYNKISEYNKVDVNKYSVQREVEAMAKIYNEVLGCKI